MQHSVFVYTIESINQVSSKALHLPLRIIWPAICIRFEFFLSQVIVHDLPLISILQDKVEFVIILVVYHFKEPDDILMLQLL